MDRYMGVVGVCIVGLYSRVVLGRLVGWTFFFFFFFFLVVFFGCLFMCGFVFCVSLSESGKYRSG